jgi:omega-amidase
MKLTISLAQMQIVLGSIEANFAAARKYIEEAAVRGSQLVLLPELWTTGYDLPNVERLARANRDLLPQMADLARRHNTWIGGSVLLEQHGKFYNTMVLNSPASEEPSLYEKIHLFRLMEEDRWLAPGEHLQMASSQWGTAGLAICYDLRFPELFRSYALAGANLLLLSAEWPARRIYHWQTLLRARAIENQCFFAAVNSAGETGGEVFGGCSAIISPWGESLVEGPPDRPELLTAEIDLQQVEEIRGRIPVFKDRRPELY